MNAPIAPRGAAELRRLLVSVAAIAVIGGVAAQVQIWIPPVTTDIYHDPWDEQVWVPPVIGTRHVDAVTHVEHIPAQTHQEPQQVTTIVHHDPTTTLVHHDATTQLVHHEPLTSIVHHDAEVIVTHHDESSYVVTHPEQTYTVHVNGYENTYWVDEYATYCNYECEWVWDEYSEDGSWDCWETDCWDELVGGHWETEYVDGYDYEETTGPWDETVVVPAYDEYSYQPPWDEEVSTPAYDEIVITPAYDEPVEVPAYDETVTTTVMVTVVDVPAQDVTIVDEPAHDVDYVITEGHEETVHHDGWLETVVLVAGYWKTISPPTIAKQIANRDDATATWANAADAAGDQPVYAGRVTGDMVSWRANASGDLQNVNYAWSATGPATIAGPSGHDAAEWAFRDGDNDTTYDWLDWAPGVYTIKCDVTGTVAGQDVSFTATLQQKVGVRTDDIVVVGWIDPQQVTIPATSGIQPGLIDCFPPAGLTAADSSNAKLKAGLLAKHIAESGVSAPFSVYAPFVVGQVDFTAFSDADKYYALCWMFKYAGNSPPESSLSRTFQVGDRQISAVDDTIYQTFAAQNTMTRYKLTNRFQAKYLVSDDFGSGLDIKPETVVSLHHDAWVGNTKDPCRVYETWTSSVAEWFLGYPQNGIFPGKIGPHNSGQPLLAFKEIKLRNEGTPNDEALAAFKSLTGQDQGQIWSTISFFSSMAFYSDTVSPVTGRNLTRDPRPHVESDPRINTQVYPTYWFYVNGEKTLQAQNQASSPMVLLPNPDSAQ